MAIDAPRLVAYIVLKRAKLDPGGRGEPVTSANVHQHLPDPRAGAKARQQLARLGFLVRRASPFAIRVEGAPSRFESVFKARVSRGGKSAGTGLGDETHWTEPPKLPASLSGIVEDVVFPRDIEHHGAAAAVAPSL